MKKRMLKTLENTRFANSPIIPCAANVGASDTNTTNPIQRIGMDDLITCLSRETYIPSRDAKGPFLFSVDHCFSIRGQGTVMTGTVLNGSVAINDNVEIPILKVSKNFISCHVIID